MNSAKSTRAAKKTNTRAAKASVPGEAPASDIKTENEKGEADGSVNVDSGDDEYNDNNKVAKKSSTKRAVKAAGTKGAKKSSTKCAKGKSA